MKNDIHATRISLLPCMYSFKKKSVPGGGHRKQTHTHIPYAQMHANSYNTHTRVPAHTRTHAHTQVFTCIHTHIHHSSLRSFAGRPQMRSDVLRWAGHGTSSEAGVVRPSGPFFLACSFLSRLARRSASNFLVAFWRMSCLQGTAIGTLDLPSIKRDVADP